jgi:small GTP-binding protein
MSNRFKVVTVGDSGVGKTALATRMAQDSFLANHVPTVGSQFVTIEMLVEGHQCILDLWDTAGQEVYRSLVGYYKRGARGAFVVCDLTSFQSFNGLNGWVSFLREEDERIAIVLFANKADLADERVLTEEQLRAFARAHKVELFEGSAKTGRGVRACFEKMGELLLAAMTAMADQTPKTVELGKVKHAPKCC